MPGIVVKPRARILHGHDWVFSSEVLKVFGKPADGDVISLKDGKDHLIGSAIYNSKSQIVARRFSRRKQELDLDFFKRRITQAAEYRARRGIDPRLCRRSLERKRRIAGLNHRQIRRLFRHADAHAGDGMRRDSIADAITDLFGEITIIERNEAPVRKAEGLELRTGVLRGNAPSQIEIEIGGVTFEVESSARTKNRFLPRSKTQLWDRCRNSRATGACWIVSQIRGHLR